MNAETKSSDQSIERVDASGDGLFVDSQWRVDRFIHCIGVIIRGEKLALFHSREGFPNDPWPISPPLQQVSKQLVANDPALLAVGMAGTSHYSTSFLIKETPRVELLVETACLIKKDRRSNADDPESLGSVYQLNMPFRLKDTKPSSSASPKQTPNANVNSSLQLQTLNHPVLSIESGKTKLPVQLSLLAQAGMIATSIPNNQQANGRGVKLIRIFPEEVSTNKATQWSYRISLQSLNQQ